MWIAFVVGMYFFKFYIRKNLFSNKIGCPEIAFHKMAAPERSRKRSYNTDEAVFAILADDDSDNETFEEETVDEDSSSSENDENQVPAPIAAPVRGAPVRKSPFFVTFVLSKEAFFDICFISMFTVLNKLSEYI